MSGDGEAAFTAWARAQQRRLVGGTYLLTGDQKLAEDLVQKALVEVASRWEQVRDADPDVLVRTTLYRDSTSWRPRLLSRRTVPDGLDPGRDEATKRQPVVAGPLDRLTSQQRAVLVLRWFDDLSEAKTAVTLGVSVGTVRRQARLALRRLGAEAPQPDSVLGEGRMVRNTGVSTMLRSAVEDLPDTDVQATVWRSGRSRGSSRRRSLTAIAAVALVLVVSAGTVLMTRPPLQPADGKPSTVQTTCIQLASTCLPTDDGRRSRTTGVATD